jgi:hypothetical protein
MIAKAVPPDAAADFQEIIDEMIERGAMITDGDDHRGWDRLLRRPAHSNSELFLVCQLSVICARSHYVRSWPGKLCCRDGFAVFHLDSSGIKRDRRRPAPEKPIHTESL